MVVTTPPLYVRSSFIPAELREMDHWMPYQLSRGRKIPLGLDNRPCDPHDPRHWRSYTHATIPYFQERRGAHGLAFALDDSGYTGLDIDRSVNVHGHPEASAQRYL